MTKLLTFLSILLFLSTTQTKANVHPDSHFFILDGTSDSILSAKGYSQSDDQTKTPKVLSELPTLEDPCLQKVIQNVWSNIKDPTFIKEMDLIEKDSAVSSILIYLSFKYDPASPVQTTCGGFNKIYYYIAVKTKGDQKNFPGSYSYGFSVLHILNTDTADTEALIGKIRQAKAGAINQDIKPGFRRQN